MIRKFPALPLVAAPIGDVLPCGDAANTDPVCSLSPDQRHVEQLIGLDAVPELVPRWSA